MTLKRQHEGSLWDGNVLYLDGVNILVVILCYSFTRRYHWGKLGEGYPGLYLHYFFALFLTTAYEFTMISKLKL